MMSDDTNIYNGLARSKSINGKYDCLMQECTFSTETQKWVCMDVDYYDTCVFRSSISYWGNTFVGVSLFLVTVGGILYLHRKFKK